MTTASRAVKATRQPSELEALLAFQMRALALPTWEAEYRFHRSRLWRFDLAWPHLRLEFCRHQRHKPADRRWT
jgi:hypothetical protein